VDNEIPELSLHCGSRHDFQNTVRTRHTSDVLADESATRYPLTASSSHPRKSILRVPTVRFPEELGPVSLSPPLAPLRAVAFGHHRDILSEPPLPIPSLPAPPPPPPLEAPQPPTLFNPQIESDDYLNAAAYELYTKFMGELSEFVMMQGEVSRQRLAVQEKRLGLRRLRGDVSQCDMQLVDYLRQCMATGVPPGATNLNKFFEASHTARDLVGPIEAEYEPLEINLGSNESNSSTNMQRLNPDSSISSDSIRPTQQTIVRYWTLNTRIPPSHLNGALDTWKQRTKGVALCYRVR
jgi:hypothetical protein